MRMIFGTKTVLELLEFWHHWFPVYRYSWLLGIKLTVDANSIVLIKLVAPVCRANTAVPVLLNKYNSSSEPSTLCQSFGIIFAVNRLRCT